MSLENVLEEVEAETAAKEKEILSAADKQAKQMRRDAQKKANQITAHIQEKAAAKAKQVKKKGQALVHLAAKKRLLLERKKIMEEIMHTTVEKISSMPSRSRAALLSKLVKNGKKELPQAKYYECNARDKKLLSKLRTGLAFSEERPLLGGVVLLSRDKRVGSNQSFEQALEAVKEEYLAQVSKRVFRRS